jgi:succinate dehydrogenase / fumarate reductase cytochrome b subunit
LIVHLLVNATIAQLGTHFQVQVDKIHSLPFVWAIEWVAIYIPILFHTFYGIWIIFTGQPNVDRYPYTKNWFYVLQRVSAFIIVAFIFFHVFALKVHAFGDTLSFDPHRASFTVHRHMMSSVFVRWFVYPIGILASCYHLANGFWTAAITWGLTISAAAQKRFGYVCAGLFAFTFVCGMIALVASTNPELGKEKPQTIEVHAT